MHRARSIGVKLHARMLSTGKPPTPGHCVNSVKLHARMLSTAKPPTLGLCIIGDEVLNGRTLDVNTQTLAQHAFAHGIPLQTVHTVPDSAERIAHSLSMLTQQHSAVFTSGGIGPTHDDITYSAVAGFFNRPLEYHGETLARMHRMIPEGMVRPDPRGSGAEQACARMALLPRDARVVFPCDDLWVPVVCLGGVHVLPGVPRLFRRMLAAYVPRWWPGEEGMRGVRGLRRVLVATGMRESALAPVLERLQGKYAAQGVRLGSYPQWPADAPKSARVVVSAVGTAEHSLNACRAELVHLLHGTVLDDTE
ncbi:hypothetical protein GGI15_003299 [Coemansia interrupta]|uniref:MoaB/Mog domain-containing protein n=1 Tax=Coemansia interrupta TaxID=1126814 RepID=A0A9W8LJ08_9FUNG|nr:hypothetical protein GGI15_003299 [Coemansia interrupta]